MFTRRSLLIGLAVLGLLFGFAAAAEAQETKCGQSETQYKFPFSLEQTYWVVNWQGLADEQTVVRVDETLERLNADNIAQTMILFMKEDNVSIPVNCAVHFLRYMELGLPDGPRQDNGFVFLIIVGKESIDVHYAVGLGLPALTAQGLTPLNRLAEETYAQSGSFDDTLVAVSGAFDEYARSKYDPWEPEAPDLGAGPVQPTQESNQIWLYCLLLVVLAVIVLILVLVNGGEPSGTYTGTPGGTSRGSPRARLPRSSTHSGSSRSSGSSPSPSRGSRRGGGGGRSGRGN